MRSVIFSLIITIFGTGASAQTQFHQDCKTLISQQDMIAAGVVCKTSKGTFERYKDSYGFYGWQDLATDLVWYDLAQDQINYINAVSFCKRQLKHKTLPSIEDIEAGIDHGSGEVFFQDLNKQIILSDLVQTGDSISVWTGNYVAKSRGSSSLDFASKTSQARCVGRSQR